MLISVGATILLTLAVVGAPATTAPVTPGALPTEIPIEPGDSPTDSAVDPLGARRDDGGMDQAWVAPTALTQPAGTVTVHDHELLIVGATWAPVERLQMTIAGTSIGSSFGALLASAKVRVLDIGRFQLAILGGGVFDFATYTTGRHLGAGAVASVCLNAKCGALVTAYGMAGPFQTLGSVDDGGGVSGTSVLFGGNALIPLSLRFKLVLEVDLAGQGNCNLHCASQVQAVVSVAGVRYHTGRLAAMLGLGIEAEGYALSPLPVVSASYRFGGS